MPASASARVFASFTETSAVAAIGGIGFAWLGFPAGLISGSVLAVALAALMGRPMAVPLPVARVSFVLLGILLGAVIRPETLKGMADWPLSIAMLILAALCIIIATASYLRVVHGWDRAASLMGASPGSLAQVMALSAEFGLDLRAIAVVQTLRVVMLTVGLPAGLALFGLAVSGPPPRPPVAPDIGELLILVLLSTATAVTMLWLRFPGGLLFGAMTGSGILHGAGWVRADLPWWMAGAGMVALGAVAGSRFANTSPRMLASYLGAALGSFAVALTIASCFVLLVGAILPFPIANLVVAFSPGAQDTMMVLALALHLDPVFVGAHHLARFVFVTLTVSWLARRAMPRDLARRERKRWWHRRATFDD